MNPIGKINPMMFGSSVQGVSGIQAGKTQQGKSAEGNNNPSGSASQIASINNPLEQGHGGEQNVSGGMAGKKLNFLG